MRGRSELALPLGSLLTKINEPSRRYRALPQGMIRTVYGAVLLFVLVVQAAFSAWACHYLAESRPGTNTRRWTLLGWLLGPGAIFVTWWFAGRGSGTSGLDEIRRLRQAK